MLLHVSPQARRSARVLAPAALTPADLAAWHAMRAADPALASPFLHPGFALAVGAVRADARVAVIEDGGEPVAFLGFQSRGRIGRPLGGGLADCQGVVAAPGWRCEGDALVAAAGLARFDFARMLAAQPFLAASRVEDAPVIELAQGFEAYARDRRAAGSGVVTQALSHARRLGRELGPLRLVPHDADPAALAQLIGWKRAQYALPRWGGALDPLARPWAVDLLRRLHATQQDGFGGMLSTLRAGGRVVAAHLGLRAGGVLHWWFPAHDPALARLAPGRILLLELIRAAEREGIARIELGGGEEGYKRRFATGAVALAAGSAGPSVPARLARRGAEALARAACRLPLAGPRAEEWLFRRAWHAAHE